MPLSWEQLQALCKENCIELRVPHGKESITKEVMIDALIKKDDLLDADNHRLVVDRLLSTSASGPSPINRCYKREFKPVDKADQYKAASTSKKRKHGKVKHRFCLHLILAMGVNVFGIHFERRGQSDRMTYANFVRAVRAERLQK